MYKIARVWPLYIMPPVAYPFYLWFASLMDKDMKPGGYAYFLGAVVTMCWTLAACLERKSS